MKKLFVGNLSYGVTSGQLEDLFNQVGKIGTLTLITDKYTGQSKGFAFVEMLNDSEADEAIKKYNDYELDGRKIVVNVARPREERPRFDDRRGDSGRNFRSSRPKRY